MTAEAPPPDADIARACEALAVGDVVAYPTEGVYGLGCDPARAAAIDRLLALKQRPASKGLILIAADLDQLAPWLAPLPPGAHERLAATWPGPVTWLLPAAADCPHRVRGDHDTLAVRVTDHPVAAALCRAWGGALVSTSANRSGEAPARSAAEVTAAFGDTVVVVPGPLGGLEGPTAIRDGRTGATLRE